MSNSWKCVGMIFPTLICIRPRSVIWNQSRNTLRLHQKAGKARFWDCFLSQNDLIASTSQNPPQKCRELKQSQSNFIFVPNYISYLCEILFYICPEITFCNLRCDNQANFPPQQYGLDKCHFDDEEPLGFPDHPIDADHITSRSLNDEFDTWNDKCYIIWPKSFDIFDIT